MNKIFNYIKVRREERIFYVITYLLLLLKAGFFFNENLSAITSIAFLVLLLFLKQHRHCIINSVAVKFVIALIVLQFLTQCVCGFPQATVYFLGIVNILTVLLYVSVMPLEIFPRVFSNIILSVSIVSLVCVLSGRLGFPFYQYFPVLTNSQGHSVYFLGLSEVWTSYNSAFGANRLQGIFWEPGAFQAFIIFAALFDIYRINVNKEKLIRLLVYAITIFFTYSTTGYICILIVGIIYIIQLSRYSWLSLIVVIPIGFILIMSFSSQSDDFLYYTMFGKLDEANAALSSGAENTASSRVDAIVYPLEAFAESPVFGIGVEGKKELSQQLGHSIFTCTPVNYFANFGLLCGLIHLFGFISFLRLKRKTALEAIVLLICVFSTTMSESLAFNPILEVLCIYGYYIYYYKQQTFNYI